MIWATMKSYKQNVGKKKRQAPKLMIGKRTCSFEAKSDNLEMQKNTKCPSQKINFGRMGGWNARFLLMANWELDLKWTSGREASVCTYGALFAQGRPM